jgi:hypothetical protein
MRKLLEQNEIARKCAGRNCADPVAMLQTLSRLFFRSKFAPYRT